MREQVNDFPAEIPDKVRKQVINFPEKIGDKILKVVCCNVQLNHVK